MGIPQIIVPGSLDFGFLPPTDPRFQDRRFHAHGPRIQGQPFNPLVRASKEELAEAGRILAERANRAKGLVAFVIPLRGFSAADIAHFHDEEANMAFVKAVRNTVKKNIKVVEVDAHILDQEFAEKIIEVFDGLTKKK